MKQTTKNNSKNKISLWMLRACRRRHAHNENHQQRPRLHAHSHAPPRRPHTQLCNANTQQTRNFYFSAISPHPPPSPLAYSFGVSFCVWVCVCFPDVGHKCYSIFMTNLHTTQSKERKAKKKIKRSGEKAAKASKWKSCQHNQIAISIGLGGGESVGERGGGGETKGATVTRSEKGH